MSKTSIDPRTQNNNIIKAIEQIKLKPRFFIQENTEDIKQIYRLGEILSTKKYGQTRICFHRNAQIKRTVRILRKDMMTSPQIQARYQKELQIISSLDHPHIIKAVEFFQNMTCLYIVVQYCQGGQLVNQIIKRRSFTQADAGVLMRQLLGVVSYLHQQNIIHRDINVENILLQSREGSISIKLTNFEGAIIQGRQKREDLYGNIYFASPEMLARSYHRATDVWSCGIVFYVLLSGTPPFDGESDQQIIDNIKKGKLDFSDQSWSKISDEAKELISLLLQKEKKRPTAQEALNHPWISQSQQQVLISNQLSSEVLNKMQAFQSPNKIKQAVQSFLATLFISNSDTKQLKKVFESIDTNGDGKLSREELLEAYSKTMGEEEALEEVERITREVDTDGSGFIDYSEFIRSTLDTRKLMSAKNLEAAFQVFDYNGSGTISASELRRVLDGGQDSSDEIWNELILQVDQDFNGVIDLREFKELVLSKIG